MIIACICGGSLEAFLIFLGISKAVILVHWLRKKFRRCKCCHEHEKERKKNV
jgi:hypothetical protein